MSDDFDFDVDAILRDASSSNAPVYRALCETDLFRGRGRSKAIVTKGNIAHIDTGGARGFWRITRSHTVDPTPLLVRQDNWTPLGAEVLSRAHGFSVYQTPASLLEAGRAHCLKERYQYAMPLLNCAIILAGRNMSRDEVKKISSTYSRFCGCAAHALSPVDYARIGFQGERDNGALIALRLATKIVENSETKP